MERIFKQALNTVSHPGKNRMADSCADKGVISVCVSDSNSAKESLFLP